MYVWLYIYIYVYLSFYLFICLSSFVYIYIYIYICLCSVEQVNIFESFRFRVQRSEASTERRLQVWWHAVWSWARPIRLGDLDRMLLVDFPCCATFDVVFLENPLGTEHPWKIIVLHYYHDLQMVKPRSHDGMKLGVFLRVNEVGYMWDDPK